MNKKIFYGLTGILTFLVLFTFLSNAQEPEKSCSGDEIEVKQVDALKSMVIKATVQTAEIGPKMGEMYGKLFGYLQEKGIAPSGAPFAVYYEFNPEGSTTFEAGVPVADKAEGNDEVVFKEFPAMKVVSKLYTGAYENMIPAYEEINKYMKDNALESNGTSWEIYLTDPEEVESPDKNQTIIYFPLK